MQRCMVFLASLLVLVGCSHFGASSGGNVRSATHDDAAPIAKARQNDRSPTGAGQPFASPPPASNDNIQPLQPTESNQAASGQSGGSGSSPAEPALSSAPSSQPNTGLVTSTTELPEPPNPGRAPAEGRATRKDASSHDTQAPASDADQPPASSASGSQAAVGGANTAPTSASISRPGAAPSIGGGLSSAPASPGEPDIQQQQPATSTAKNDQKRSTNQPSWNLMLQQQ